MSKKFHLGDILSITTGILVSPRKIDGVYDILNYMTVDNLYTHQLSRATKECAPYLLMELPWLKEIDASQINEENWREWLDEHVSRYGEFHDVRPIHPEDHNQIDPIEELREMRKTSQNVIAICLPEVDDENIDFDIDFPKYSGEPNLPPDPNN